jgi:Tfp pilus assembly protein FimT
MRRNTVPLVIRDRAHSRFGVTLVELIIGIMCTGIVVAMATSKFLAITSRYRTNEAVMIVAGDLRQAVSLAARRQKPVTISLEAPNRYVFKDRGTPPDDSVRLRRNLRLAGDVGTRTVSFSPGSVTVYPVGVVDRALTVTLGDNRYTRQVTLSAAGQVRVVPAP